ncbi:MAG: ABC transporter ATP-binding protein [Thaumarchaeota archaeon]|nr:ABC transporter ATP-binding protein [Nitrososphaerota archaeon]
MIETENLTKKFGDVTAVEGLTLRVGEGEVFGFLGPNGAGKTTTVRMLTCLISKTSGDASIDGHNIGKGSEAQEVRKIIGLLPESVGMYDDLSAYKNLDYYGRLYECTEAQRRERIERFLRMLGLWDKKDMAVGTFSKGMRQKVAIARALIHEPKVVFLDEPTANLDPESSKTIREFILELKREKRTVFLNTHNLDEAQRVCDRVGILKGRLLAVGPLEVLRGSLWPRKTVVQLERVSDPVVAAVKKLGPANMEASGDTLLIDVTDPEKENPEIINAVVAAGGRILYVTESSPTLEDVYLKLVRN